MATPPLPPLEGIEITGPIGPIILITPIPEETEKHIIFNTKIPNPYGSKGKPDHQESVEEMRLEWEKRYSDDPEVVITSNESIRKYGINRRPDVAAQKNGMLLGVGEVARTNKDGSLKSREQIKQKEYQGAGIPTEVKTLPFSSQ